MIQFRLFGIPITILPWFWLTLGVLGALSFNLSDKEGLLHVLLFVMAGFISILVHEMGHALTIKFFKQPTQVVLEAFGGYASYPPNSLTRLQNFLVTAAGPLIQLILAAVVFLQPLASVSPFQGFGNFDTNGHFFLFILGWISIIWAIFNCMPVYPLDGGQMLNAILGPKRIKITYMVGVVCGGLLAIYGFFNGQPMIGMFMGMFAYQNFQRLQQA